MKSTLETQELFINFLNSHDLYSRFFKDLAKHPSEYAQGALPNYLDNTDPYCYLFSAYPHMSDGSRMPLENFKSWAKVDLEWLTVLEEYEEKEKKKAHALKRLEEELLNIKRKEFADFLESMNALKPFMLNSNVALSELVDPEQFVNHGFLWASSPEGHPYWLGIGMFWKESFK